MKVDLFGLTMEAPAVTFYLWSPWRSLRRSNTSSSSPCAASPARAWKQPRTKSASTSASRKRGKPRCSIFLGC